jgi:hypothetical protein
MGTVLTTSCGSANMRAHELKMMHIRRIAGKLLGLGPARQGVRTVSGPEGSSTKGCTLGAAGVPGPSSVLAILFCWISQRGGLWFQRLAHRTPTGGSIPGGGAYGHW